MNLAIARLQLLQRWLDTVRPSTQPLSRRVLGQAHLSPDFAPRAAIESPFDDLLNVGRRFVDPIDQSIQLQRAKDVVRLPRSTRRPDFR